MEKMIKNVVTNGENNAGGIIMDFDNMIEEFGTYIAELKNFKSYLQSDSSVISTKLLGGIRTEHIIESIEYNIANNGYTSKSIASKYAIAIAQFYRYANQQNWFTNNDLLNHINMYRLDEDSYYYQIGNYIRNNLKLSSKEPKVACNNNEINDLITTIEEYFDKYSEYLIPYFYVDGYSRKFENDNEEYDAFLGLDNIFTDLYHAGKNSEIIALLKELTKSFNVAYIADELENDFNELSKLYEVLGLSIKIEADRVQVATYMANNSQRIVELFSVENWLKENHVEVYDSYESAIDAYTQGHPGADS